MDQRITECGAGDGVPRDWRHVFYPEQCRRWAALGYLRSYHVYLMSSDDPQWERLGHTYDETVVKILATAAGEWKARKEEVRPVGIAAALLPSNQDRNVSPVRADYNEGGGMHWLAPLVEEKCRALGINARRFEAQMESRDSYKLEGLYKQQEQANNWLVRQTELHKVLVNFHTDSGNVSHTYAIFGSRKEQKSRLLAEIVGPLVHVALSTEKYEAFEKLGNIDYNTYVFYEAARFPAVLLELCSHAHAGDLARLYSRPHEVATAIARGIARYGGAEQGVNWQAEAERWRKAHDEKLAELSRLAERMRKINTLSAGV